MSNLNRDISRIIRTIRRMSAAADQENELGQGERRALHFIHHSPGVTQKDICDKFDINKAATARQCASLEEKGYIRREKNEQDGRSWLLYPTEKAETFKQEHIDSEEKIYEWLTQDLSDEEKAQFAGIIQKICSRIDSEHSTTNHHTGNKER